MDSARLYPFQKLSLDSMEGPYALESWKDLRLPKWMDDISQISNNFLGHFGPPIRFTIIHTELVASGPLVSFLILKELSWNETENFFHFIFEEVFVSAKDLVLSSEDLEGLESVGSEDVVKVQKTAAFILIHQRYIKSRLNVVEQLDADVSKRHRSRSSSIKTPERGDEVNNLKIQLDSIRELKQLLFDIVAKIDFELLEFSTKCNPLFAWAEWNDLVEKKDKVLRLLEKLNRASILELIKEQDPSQNKNEILVDIIGLKSELANVIFEDSNHEREEDQGLILSNFFSITDCAVNNCLIVMHD